MTEDTVTSGDTSGDSEFKTVIDEGEITRFLGFLDSEREIFSFRFMDSQSKAPLQSYSSVHTTAAGVIENCKELLRRGTNFTLHVCLNRMKDRGMRAVDALNPRVLCVDIDREVGEEELENLKSCCQLIVESSPNKYHLYWKVSPVLPLERWSFYQTALAHKFSGGDYSLSQHQKTIRVPGVSRLTKSGATFVPKIIPFQTFLVNPVSETEMQSIFPNAKEHYEKAQNEIAAEKKKIKKHLQADGGSIPISSQGRNTTLFSAACDIRRTNKEDDEGSLQAAIRAVNERFVNGEEGKGPLEEKEVEKIIRSSREAVEREREEKNKVMEEKKAELLPLPFEYDFSDDVLKINRFTTLGVVKRVLQRFSKCLIRTGAIVYAFDSSEFVWRPQKGGKGASFEVLIGYAESCLRDTVNDPEFISHCCITDKGDFSDTKRKATEEKYLSVSTANSVAGYVAGSHELIRKNIGIFDAQTALFFCKNGVLDLGKLELRNPEPTDYLLQRSGVDWNVEAECPQWIEFLRQVFQSNDDENEMVEFIQQIFGYSLTGNTGAQKLFVHYGEGSNGKSIVLRTLGKLLGNYSTIMSGSSLSKSKSAVEKEMERIGAKIEGKRVVIIDDLDTATQWSGGNVKLLTGKQLPARKLYEEERDIPNRAKFHIGCNTAPSPETQDYAILRRICIIPYKHRFEPSATEDARIEAFIEAELPGIFRWAVQGWRVICAAGGDIKYPSESFASLEEYKAEHFTFEKKYTDVIKQVCLKPNGVEAAMEMSWKPLHEIVSVVNEILKKNIHERVSSEAVGRILNGLGFAAQRRRTELGRIRFYCVKLNLNYVPPEVTTVL